MAVLAITAAISISSFGFSGTGMDEGRLVAYPEFVRSGLVPGRDFESFYGPGGPYLIGGFFKVFGPSVSVERAVGLGFRLLIVLALFLLILPWGSRAAALGALVSAGLMYPLGLGALDWFGALACALIGLALLARAANPSLASSDLAVPASGFVSAFALIFRPDIAPAVVLASLPLFLLLARRSRIAWALSFAVGLLPLLVWLAVVGPHHISRLVSDLRNSRSGRRLPLPSPISDAFGQVVFASIFTTLAVFVGWGWLQRLQAGGFRRRLLLSLGLFSLAIMPTALERADSAHILEVGCVVLAVLVALLVELWPQLRLRPRTASRTVALVAAAALAGLGLVATVHTFGYAVKSNGLGLGLGPEPKAYDVRNDGRSYPIESAPIARGLNQLLPQVDAHTQAGDSVFVGPLDLSRTKYGDTFLYYLLPKLSPASFYTELNAGTANASDSTLPEELRRADVLLLTTRYDAVKEPNSSDEPGSPAANRVVRKHFCLQARAGTYRLFLPCR